MLLAHCCLTLGSCNMFCRAALIRWIVILHASRIAHLHGDWILYKCAMCVYVCTGVEYRPALSRCSFVDRVPGLRTLAASAFADHTTTVESELRAHFAETRAFSEIWEEDRASTSSNALAKTLYELQKLGRVWAPPVLPAPSYVLAIGGLLGKVAVSCYAKPCCKAQLV